VLNDLQIDADTGEDEARNEAFKKV